MAALATVAKVARLAVPVGLLLSFGYLDYAVGYVIGYDVWPTNHGAAAVWAVLGYLQLTTIIYWARLFQGPGKLIKIEPYDLYENSPDLHPPPDMFPCDADGFPYWCGVCQSLKAPRSFHLSDLGYCVPKFDHFCIWVGTVIGQENTLAFTRFLQHFAAMCITCIVFAAINFPSDFPHHINLHYVAVMAYGSIALLMVMTLYVSQFRYIYYNMTMFDDLTRNQAKRYNRWKLRYHQVKDTNRGKRMRKHMPRKETGLRYVSVAYNGGRVVVAYKVLENPYDFGWKHNLVARVTGNSNDGDISASWGSVVKSLVVLFIPYTEFPQHFGPPDTFGPKFTASINHKIENNQFTLPRYLSEKASV